jgi:hypothetical protein
MPAAFDPEATGSNAAAPAPLPERRRFAPRTRQSGAPQPTHHAITLPPAVTTTGAVPPRASDPSSTAACVRRRHTARLRAATYAQHQRLCRNAIVSGPIEAAVAAQASRRDRSLRRPRAVAAAQVRVSHCRGPQRPEKEIELPLIFWE